MVGAHRVDLEARAEQRAAAVREHTGEVVTVLRARRRARGTGLPSTSGRVQPNVSSVAGFTSITRPSWSTITMQSSDARSTASLRPWLAASARSERLRAVTSTIDAITADDLAARVADRAGRRADLDLGAVAVQPPEVEVTDRLALGDVREVLEEEVELALGDDRAHSPDHLVCRPAEDLAGRCVPRAHAPVEARSRRSRRVRRRSAHGGARRRSGSPRTAPTARARWSPGSRRRAGSAAALPRGEDGRPGRRPRCSRCAGCGDRAAARRASGSARRSGRGRRSASGTRPAGSAAACVRRSCAEQVAALDLELGA